MTNHYINPWHLHLIHGKKIIPHDNYRFKMQVDIILICLAFLCVPIPVYTLQCGKVSVIQFG